MRISTSRLATVLCLLAFSQTGCRWAGTTDRYSPFKSRVEPVFTEETSQVEIVDDLNANSSRLQSWQSHATIKVKGPATPMPVSLSSVIAVEAPKNFRLRAQSTFAQADMGSNNSRMWFWVQPGADNVITARHSDVPMIQKHVNLPFDAEWLMEVLGVVPLEKDRVVLHPLRNKKSPFRSLYFDQVADDGRKYRRIITVDPRTAVIVHHKLVHPNGTTIAEAELSHHKKIDDDIMMPHRIKLNWPLTKVSFEMKLKEIEVNCAIDESRWEVPSMSNSPTIDLGEQIAARNGINRHQQYAEPDIPDWDGRQSFQEVREQLQAPIRTVEEPVWDD